MKISPRIASFLVVIAAKVTLAQGQVVTFSASDAKADLEYLYKTLQESHYNLYAYVSKRKYDKAFRAIQRAIGKDSLSLLETTQLFQKLTATGNVGHSEIDFPVQPYISFAQGGGTVFPLELAFEDGKAYVRKNLTGDSEANVGDQLLDINGKPIKDIQEAIHPYLSAERPYFKNTKLEFWSFPRLYWSVFGEKKEFVVKLKGADAKVVTRSLEAIPVMEYESKRGGEILGTEPSFKYMKDVAYLNPGPFSSADPNGERKFKAFIDSVFTDLASKGIDKLIVDLRNNSGGHNAYSDHLISYFADKPFRWYSSFRLKTSKVLKEQTATGEDDYTTAILSHGDGEVFDYVLPMQNPAPEAARFEGKVYVLVNRQTYSMAAVSAALIQDYGFAKIIGEETGDVPTLYASQFSFTLPKTGIIVKVPKGYIIRPNGDETLSGVKPNYQVRDHLLDEEDEILQYTLKKIAAPSEPKQ